MGELISLRSFSRHDDGPRETQHPRQIHDKFFHELERIFLQKNNANASGPVLSHIHHGAEYVPLSFDLSGARKHTLLLAFAASAF